MDEFTKEEKEQFLNAFIKVIADIGYGSGHGFGALEGIAVALAGKGLKNPIGESLDNIADAINNHAQSLDDLSETIKELLNK